MTPGSPSITPISCPYGTTAVMAYYVAGASPALIDTGGAAHPRGAIAPALRELGASLSLSDIRQIVNTHGHWDHAGGNAAVVAASNANVTVHAAGATLVSNTDAHCDGYFTQAARVLDQPDQVAALRAALPESFGGGVTPSRLLADGDEFDLGGATVTALHLPGHSADMTAFYWERDGILIAGDAAQGTGSRAGAGPLYFHVMWEARASIARLQAIPFHTLHVSHPFGRLNSAPRATVYDHAEGLAFLAESLTALDIMTEALQAALREQPDAPFPALARLATAELARAAHWPVEVDPQTGVPHNAAPTFHLLWQELTGSSGSGGQAG